MCRWDELDKKWAVQSGKGPGEFGPDYSERKRYQLGYGNESPSPLLKEYLDSVGGGRYRCNRFDIFCNHWWLLMFRNDDGWWNKYI